MKHVVPLIVIGALLLAALLILTSCSQGGDGTAAVPTDEAAAVATPSSASAPAEEPLTPEPIVEPAAAVWSTPIPWPDIATEPGTLMVDAGQSFGRISPWLYGSNYGPWVAVPFDFLDEAADSGVTMLRFPGGEFGDRNDIQELQLDRFIQLAKQLGVEPTISTRLRDGTPEQAAEMVRYVNIEQGYGVRYWSPGNEPNLYDDVPFEQSISDWRALAEAMKAVDPTIVLLGPEVSQYTGGDGPGPSNAHAYLDQFLVANGDLVDIVTIHRYPFGSTSGESYTAADLLASTAEWDAYIPDLRARIRDITGRDLPVGVTEISTDWTHIFGTDSSPDSYAAALWLADVLGRMARQRVDIVNQFVFTSQDSQGSWGLIGGSGLRPSYYAYQLYKLFGNELLFAASSEDNVGLYAARREDGALTIMAINLGEEAVSLPLRLAGHTGGTAGVYRLDPERVAAGTVAEPLEQLDIADGAMLSLPGRTATLYVVP